MGSKLILTPHKTQARASYLALPSCQNIKTVYGVADYEEEPRSWCKLKKLKVRRQKCSVSSSQELSDTKGRVSGYNYLSNSFDNTLDPASSSSRELGDTLSCLLAPQDCQEKHQHLNCRRLDRIVKNPVLVYEVYKFKNTTRSNQN